MRIIDEAYILNRCEALCNLHTIRICLIEQLVKD